MLDFFGGRGGVRIGPSLLYLVCVSIAVRMPAKIAVERLQPSLQRRKLSFTHHGYAGPQPLGSFGAGRGKGKGADSEIEQGFDQIFAAHAGVGDGEVETICQRLTVVVLIHLSVLSAPRPSIIG